MQCDGCCTLNGNQELTKDAPKSMAGTSVSAMSNDIRGLSGSTGERCARPKPQDAMAPLVMMVCDSPGTRRRSASRRKHRSLWSVGAAYS
jgi:hypothetical protein